MDFGVQVNVYRTTWQEVAASVLAMDSTRAGPGILDNLISG